MTVMDTPSEETGPPSKWPARIAVAIGVLVAIAGIGGIGQLSGAGWFGYRDWMYGPGELYALNMGDEPLWISVDGMERLEVPAQNAQIADLMGGTSHVVVTDTDEAVVDEYDITIDGSDAFLKLTDEGCLAVVDITPFYGGNASGALDFEAYLRRDARVWIPQSRNVVWPRKDFPSRLEGGQGKGLWFELVACDLFEEPKFLDGYLAARIEQRMEKALGRKRPQK